MAAKDKGQQQPAPASEPKPKRQAKLTRDEVNAIYREQGGKCYVYGTALDPLEHGREWHVSDGRAISERGRGLKGSRSYDELRAVVLKKLADAQARLDTAKAELAAAHNGLSNTTADYGWMIKDGAVVFAGERTTAPPSPLAAEPAGGAGDGLSAAGGD